MNYFITDAGLRHVMELEQSVIAKYGSEGAMKIALKLKGVKLSYDGDGDDDEDDQNPVGYAVSGNLAIITIDGATRANASWLTRIYGMPTYDDIKLRFNQAYADPAVKMVFMDINSPGGQANGTNSMAKFISDFDSKIKPVVAYTSGLCASAAVWYGTAGSALCADADADVGSIGAINVFTSYARQLKESGIDATVTRSGPYKGVPNPYEKLSEKGQEVLTEEVQKWHSRFLVGLAANIGQTPDVINKNIASGKMFSSQQALNLGLVKSIISREQLIANLNAKLDNSTRSPGRA